MSETEIAVQGSHVDSFAETCVQRLVELNEKIVFAESCTGGMICSTMASVPGVSRFLCGSLVTYRPASKRRWIGVNKSTINAYSTESAQVAEEMAIGALKKTPEANWSLSIVGHLGPDAPAEKDGRIWVCICRRSRKGNIKVKCNTESALCGADRVRRQKSATENALTFLARILMSKVEKDENRKRISA